MGDLSKNFSRSEFACQCGCGFDTVDIRLVPVLEYARSVWGKPIRITSGCRCADHNESVGGAKNSKHVQGRAADFVVSGVPASVVYEKLNTAYKGKLGLGKYPSWVHVDTRTDGGARW